MKSSLIAFVFTFISVGLFGQVIPFQGKLTENGVPVNGTKDIVVSITALSWTETHTGVQITDGLYSINLGSETALPGDIFTGVTERQLDITVSGVVLSPISLKAPLEKRAFLFGQTDTPISDQNSQPVGYHYVVDYNNTSPGPVLRGLQMDVFGTGRKYALRGNTFSTISDPDNKIGILGSATGDGSGNHTGIFGQAFGKGLFNAAIEGTAGGEGNGVGSSGFDPNGSYNTGVVGNAFSNLHGNTGVFGHASGTTGFDNIGVVGWSEVTSGEENKGVLGWAKGPGVNKGIVGIATDGTENWAGWFDGNVQTNGRLYTMDYNGAENENITMKAESSGPGDGATGWGTGSYNIGLRSDAANNIWGNVGLTGYATGTVGTDNAGGTFFSQVDDGTTTIGNKGIYSSASGPGINYGVYGDANGGVENWAGYFNGDVKVTGDLSLDGASSNNSNSIGGQTVDQVTQQLNVGGDGTGRHFGLIINVNSQNGRQNNGIRADAFGSGRPSGEGYSKNVGGEFYSQDNVQNNIGVMGNAWGSIGENNYGGTFYATTAGGVNNYGIYSTANGGTNNWAGWFEGEVKVAGGGLNLDGDLASNGNYLFMDAGAFRPVEIRNGEFLGSGAGEISLLNNSNGGTEGLLLTGWGDITAAGTVSAGGFDTSGTLNVGGDLSSNGNYLFMDAGAFRPVEIRNGEFLGSGAGEISLLNNSNGGTEGLLMTGWGDITAAGSVTTNGINLGGDLSSTGNYLFMDAGAFRPIELRNGEFLGSGAGEISLLNNSNGGTEGLLLTGWGDITAAGTVSAGGFDTGGTLNVGGDLSSGGGYIFMDAGAFRPIELRNGQLLGSGAGEISLLNNSNGGTEGLLMTGWGDITAAGTVTATTLTQTSDRRYKKNIKPIENTLSKTLKLRGVSYNWKDESKTKEIQIGLIAQEVEDVYPEFVHTNDKGMKSVNYSQMVAVLIEAVKELNTKITNLENENTQLKASLAKSEENKQKIDNLQSQLTGILKLLDNSQNDENVTTSED